MAFATLSAKLTADIRDFSRKMSDATAQVNRVRSGLGSGIASKGNTMLTFATKLSDKYKDANKELRSHNLGLKDTARIIQGIMISQAFYAAAQAIRNAVTALWDFNVALDYMQVTYSALFGSTEVAKDFMAVLQEHSINTIFDYQSLANASKKLLAYGIEYENLMFIMEGLTNLGAMSGDAAALDRVALALGQIYTKGKLSAEEMRQLANAYIPITEILQTKFGLTGDDLKRVGELNLPAADVINAIVDYANENFGSVGDAAMYTITGLQNRIVDTLKVVGSSMLQPLTTAYKSFLVYISEGLETIRGVYETGGIGGVFEYLVPDENTRQLIRQFLANLSNLFDALVRVGAIASRVFGSFSQILISAFNVVSPLIIGATNALATLVNAFLDTEFGAATLRTALVVVAASFVLLKVQALGALVVSALTSVIQGLSKALLVLASVITKPIGLIAVLIGLIAAVVGISKTANKSISGLFDTISGVTGGKSSADVLQEVNQSLTSSADAAGQFSNRLREGAGAANELSNAISGAGKEAKKTGSLLSFDEVFKLPEKKDESDSGGSGYGGLIGDLESLTEGFKNLGADLIPEIPDFGEYAKEWVTKLFGSIDDATKNMIGNVGTGSLIGGGLGLILGTLLGNPKLGAGLGAVIGGGAPLVWEWLKGAINNTASGGAIGVWSAISNAVAKAGGVGLGTLLKEGFAKGGIKGFASALGGALKTTGLKGILKGGLVGMGIGLIVDILADLLWKALAEKMEGASIDKAKIGQFIGGILGTVAGTLLGGPVGSIIGSVAGTLLGGFLGLIWDISMANIDKYLIGPVREFAKGIWEDIVEWWNDPEGIVVWTSETFQAFHQWILDTSADVSKWYDDTFGKLTKWWDDTKSNFTTWWSDTKSGFTTWWNDTWGIFTDWDSITSDTLSDWWSDTKTGFTTWWNDTTGGFTTWWSDTKTGFATWREDTNVGLATWWEDTKSGFSNWTTETHKKLSKWWTDITSGFTKWCNDAIGSINKWWTDTKNAIYGWIADTFNKFVKWADDTLREFREWGANAASFIGGFGIAAFKHIDQWVTDSKKKVKDLWHTLFDSSNWTSGWESVKKWFSDLFKSIENWFIGPNGLKSKIGNWWKGLWDGKEVKVNTNTGGTTGSYSLLGHATGGVFNREHIARFAEGNRAEAIIPLENATAMRPFVDAVSDGILASLAPVVAQGGSSNANNLPPMYVGTLIADERGLKELYKKFEIIQMQENARRGIPVTL